MKILRYLRRTTSLVLILLLLLTTFGGCVSSAKTFYDYEDQFYAELEKIPKEVEGYALVETGEKQQWWDYSINKGEDIYTFDTYARKYLVIKKNTIEIKKIDINDSSSSTIQKIFSIYNNFNNKLVYDGVSRIIGYKCLDNRLLVLVNTYSPADSYAFNRFSVKWWPPLLFEYDIDNDVFKYAGFFDTRGKYFNMGYKSGSWPKTTYDIVKTTYP